MERGRLVRLVRANRSHRFAKDVGAQTWAKVARARQILVTMVELTRAHRSPSPREAPAGAGQGRAESPVPNLTKVKIPASCFKPCHRANRRKHWPSSVFLKTNRGIPA